MECKNGQKYPTPADIFSREIEWKRRNAYARGLQLAFASRLPFPFPAQAMRIHQNNFPVFPPPMPPSARNLEPSPFMNTMDEISYWVTTKRAPCLLNYDNAIKRQNEQAHCSKDTLKTTPNAEVTHPKNKKRKLKLLNDSESSDKHQNVFFDKSLSKDIKAPKSLQSDSLASSIDFKIKPTVQRKPKRPKVQKKNKDVTPKIKKVCTSTPKTNLRRSLRKVCQTNNSYSQLNNSFEILNASAIAAQDKLEIKVEHNEKINLPVHNKNETNGKYDDSSDVSGFTANYIRSTKVHSSKTATNTHSKGNRNQVKNKKNTSDIILCVNKSANTGNPNTTVLNCSTDSSQNIINLVTVQQDATDNVDKSTSLLKFVNIKNNQEPDSEKNSSRQRNTIVNLETSFQSRSSNASRYPIRQRKVSMVESEKDMLKVNTPEKTKAIMSKESKSERKENSANMISKTRSGRRIGADVDPEGSACTILNIDSTGEQVRCSPVLNVGGRRSRKNNSRSPRNSKTYKNNKKDLCDVSEKNIVGESSCVQLRSTRRTRQVTKANNETRQSSQKDSLRDKSGFATCFTDSDSDNEPLKQRKFFC